MAVKETTIEIKLQNLKSNFKFLKSKINTDTKFMAVVKAFSYGSDSLIISEELEKNGVDYLAVAYVREGISLRREELKFLFWCCILKRKILMILLIILLNQVYIHLGC
jgi:alanine racemase